ncbi:MAG: hypothetical protein Q9198_000386 [Flavoplaca austrocitrina]
MDSLDGTQEEPSKAKAKTQAPSARKQVRNGSNSEVDGVHIVAIDFSNIEVGQAKYYTGPQAAPPSYNQEPADVVKDYLSTLRRHIQAILHQMLPQSVALSTPVNYIITVLAMWSDIAVKRTRKCAELAGMGTSLTIVSEAEAAAIWALQEVPPGSIEIGDTFVVCDAGGGTVDLISYKVTGLKPILRAPMVVPGKGKKCGSSFLNRRFEESLKGKLGVILHGRMICLKRYVPALYTLRRLSNVLHRRQINSMK